MAERYGAEIDHPRLASAADLRSMRQPAGRCGCHWNRVTLVATKPSIARAVPNAAQLNGSGVSASSGPRRADFFQCESDCSGSAEEDERVPRDRCPEHREVQAKDAERPEPGADYP